MRAFIVSCFLAVATAVHAQPQQPDLAAQRDALKRLAFLVGTWSGEATAWRGPGEPIKLTQTEDVQFKLDGLVMLVEGTGRLPNGEVVFQALATIAYDDAAKAYRIRAHNGGRYVDADLKVVDNGFEWGFQAGPATVRFVMHLNDRGEWIETGEVTIGAAPPRRTVELTVRRQR